MNIDTRTLSLRIIACICAAVLAQCASSRAPTSNSATASTTERRNPSAAVPGTRTFVDSAGIEHSEVYPTVDPEVLGSNLKYPEDARKASIEGKVTVTALIDEEGRVLKTRIDASDDERLD